MRAEDFADSSPGHLVTTDGGALAFVPNPTPTTMPVTADLVMRLSEASAAAGALAGMTRVLPNPYMLIRPFLRREAVVSSRIEGTRAGLDELLVFEETHREQDPDSDVREVANYVRALEYGFARPEERPISLGIIKEMHFLLMDGVRGGDRHPGEFRVIQNYIGRAGAKTSEARFVPAPPTELSRLLADLERAMNEPSDLPPLVRVAYLHYQFETIHPFLDGNGRLGRLLIPLLLSEWGFLPQPVLYLSDYFDHHSGGYRDGLLRVSQQGDWAGWLAYFLDAVTAQSVALVARTEALLALQRRYRLDLQSTEQSMRLLLLVEDLFERPTITIKRAAKRLGVVVTTAAALIQRLEDRGILVEVTGGRRNRVYLARGIVDVLNAD